MRRIRFIDLWRRPVMMAALVLMAGVSLPACGILDDPGFIVYSVGSDGDRDIGAIRPDGTQGRIIVANEADDFSPRWSVDRQRLAFLSDRDGNVEMYVANADGSNVMRATNSVVSESAPTWSPDGHSIAYVAPDAEGNPHIFLLDLSELLPRRLTFGTFAETDPVWSEDGKWIAFSVLEANGVSAGIFLRNPKGVNRIQVTHGPDYSPAWAPDSRRIVFVSDRDGNSEIYMVKLGDNNSVEAPVRLTDDPAVDSSPIWSTSNNHIAFLSDRSGDTDIYTVRSNGEDLHPLTANEVEEQAIVWGPDGSLAFISQLNDLPGLFTMSSNGAEQTQILAGDASYTLPDW